MAAVVVDTDVVSYFFKKDSRARLYHPHTVGRDLAISFMTLAEWTIARRWGQTTRDRLERFLQAYAVRYADRGLCRIWAEVSEEANRHGRPMDKADAWIAATALAFELPLVTNNTADFDRVQGLTVLSAE